MWPLRQPLGIASCSAGWLYANAKTPAATFAGLVRPSADVRTLNCCRDWHVAREEPVQDLCRCVRPEMWLRLAPSKGPLQGRPRLNLHGKSPQARAPHMRSESPSCKCCRVSLQRRLVSSQGGILAFQCSIVSWRCRSISRHRLMPGCIVACQCQNCSRDLHLCQTRQPGLLQMP